MDELKQNSVTTNIMMRDQDGLNIKIYFVSLTHLATIDIIEAVKAACLEYCKTEEGKDTYRHNCDNFNWGDFLLCVPDEICAKHGFTKEEHSDVVEVDYNEQLVDSSDIL